MTRLLSVVLLLGLASASAAEKSAPRDGQSVALGCELYKQHCAACHGKCGKGDGAAGYALRKRPKNLTDPDYADDSDEDLLETITDGKREMPAHKKLLTERQRLLIVGYLRGLGK